jgi:hypothetical protein
LTIDELQARLPYVPELHQGWRWHGSSTASPARHWAEY